MLQGLSSGQIACDSGQRSEKTGEVGLPGPGVHVGSFRYRATSINSTVVKQARRVSTQSAHTQTASSSHAKNGPEGRTMGGGTPDVCEDPPVAADLLLPVLPLWCRNLRVFTQTLIATYHGTSSANNIYSL